MFAVIQEVKTKKPSKGNAKSLSKGTNFNTK